MDSLIETIRNELARCLEKAYPKISVKGAMSILSLPNEKVLAEYAKSVRNITYDTKLESTLCYLILLFSQRNWIYADGYYTFSEDVNEMNVDEEMPYVNVAKEMLQYAREMEMII